MEWMILPLKRYADFEGRSRRLEYWMFYLFQLLVYVILFAIFIVAGPPMSGSDDTSLGAHPFAAIFLGLMVLFALGTVIPNIAVTVRRFHDQDKSGWMYLLMLIPYLGGLIVFVFMLLPGTVGENQYGLDPKGAGGDIREVFS
ncbi:MAG: DUF805 domain-containing protein [Pseudomonadota bacterium]